MSAKKFIWMMTALAALALAAAGAQGQDTQKVIKHETIKPTPASSGAAMFKSYCAVCHGVDGKGGGPAAESLKVPPSDLTVLSKNNGGKFPSNKVSAAIRGEGGLPAHGTREMPVWGHLFWTMSGGQSGEVQMRVANLTNYIESLQAK